MIYPLAHILVPVHPTSLPHRASVCEECIFVIIILLFVYFGLVCLFPCIEAMHVIDGSMHSSPLARIRIKTSHHCLPVLRYPQYSILCSSFTIFRRVVSWSSMFVPCPRRRPVPSLPVLWLTTLPPPPTCIDDTLKRRFL